MPKLDIQKYALRKAKYVEGLMMGMGSREAQGYAGFFKDDSSITKKLKNDPWVIEQIENMTKYTLEKARVSKEKVQEIVLEAIDIARIKGDPDPMIRGAGELSKLNGYYAPEKKEISVDGEIAVKQLETLSDAELLSMLGEEQTPIEAEFERITDES